MNQWLLNQLKRLRRNAIIIFLVGGLSAMVLEEAVNRALARMGLPGVLLGLLVVVGLVVIYYLLRSFYHRLFPPAHAIMGPAPQPKVGLIWLYSRPETLNRALDHHGATLRYLWLIVTPEAEVKAKREVEERDGVTVLYQQVTQAWSPDQVANAVRAAVGQAKADGLAETQLICDVTGGTTAMSVGAIHACLAGDVAMEMVPAHYDEGLKAQVPLTPIELNMGGRSFGHGSHGLHTRILGGLGRRFEEELLRTLSVFYQRVR